MKRYLSGVVMVFSLLVGLSPMARASSFVSVSNGVTTLSCDNSTATGVTACGAAGFTTSLQSNIISFTGMVGGYSVTKIILQGNQPGTLSSAFSLDTKTAVTNVAAGSSSLTIVTASNDFILPMGSPLALSASQSGTFTQSQAGDQEAFTAYGNAANTLAATGVADSTPACINPASVPPAGVQSCSATGIPTTFSRSGNFALAGVEVITLSQGDIANFASTASTGGSGVCSSAIGDFVWNDVNHNGIQDAGEPGIPNIMVQLYNSTGAILLATTTTDASGIYGFSGLCGGTYIVTIPSQSGLTGPGYISTLAFQGNSPANDSNGSPALSSPPQSAQVILPDNTIDTTIDFGYYVPPPSPCLVTNTALGSISSGSAGGFALLALNNGSMIINSATSITGNVGYSAHVTSTTNQKIGTFNGTAFVHSTATFNYTPATYQPSGGIIVGGAADTLLNQANSDAASAAAYFAGLPSNGSLGSVTGNLNLNAAGSVTVFDVSSWNTNSNTLTLNGTASSVFVFRVTGSFDWSQSRAILNGVQAANIVFYFPNASNITINKSSNVFAGTILAPTGSAIYHNPATFNGRIIALNIDVHSDFNITAPICH